jgi:hypothetical protein
MTLQNIETSKLPKRGTHSMTILKKTKPDINFGKGVNLMTPSLYKTLKLKHCLDWENG